MGVSSETKLNQQKSSDYKSCAGSSEFDDGPPSNGFTCDLQNKQGERKRTVKVRKDTIQLKDLSAGTLHLFNQRLSKLKETNEDCCRTNTPVQLYAVPIILAVGVTIALALQIHLDASLVSIKGVASDHERCTVLSESVLRDGGSSVDAAIAGALCLGVVHPHVSGVGGGGVMLIHDIRHNKTRVINFEGSAPNDLREDLLQNASGVQAGLLVGVPGMLMGLHHAHSLYGRLSWGDVIRRAAEVAREGFNVSQSLAVAISELEREALTERFRNLFIPGGKALSPGSHLRMPGVADVLEAGLFSFYHGAVSQEIQEEVRANGGVLSAEDIGNYSSEVQQPLEGRYGEYIIQVPPPPSAGAALLAALNLLAGFHLSGNDITVNQTHHWVEKALAAALALARKLGDPKYNSSVSELLSVMMSKSQSRAELLQQKSSRTSPSDNESLKELLTGQVVVMGPDDLVVSVASSLNGPFGSRIITQSGIILNSLILSFYWSNHSRGLPQANQMNHIGPGKRPLTFLMPSVMVPVWNKCGTYMGLSSSGGPNRLREITQMLELLILTNRTNESLSLEE
nr:glutathione hydrolase 7 isoform X1 [Nothobranchius furzeri]